MDKAALRAQSKQLVAAMNEQQRATESTGVCRRLETLLSARRRVLLYSPLATEINVWPMAYWLLERGIEVALPRVDWTRESMEAAAYEGDGSLEATEFGLRQPTEDAEVYESPSLDAVVAPGLAFDLDGGRLGRGGGYYDRFLAGMPDRVEIIGVCFLQQVLERVPLEPHDRRMDVVVTADSVSPCRPKPGFAGSGGGR
jgi:5-formyltetrahydrofolate cyclo-ligase